MKRIFIASLLSIMMIGIITAANADVLFATNSFEFLLPDSWYYEEASMMYARCVSGSGDNFQFYESSTELPETIPEIVDSIADYFGAADYITRFEEIEIADQKTALVEFHSTSRCGYMTMFKRNSRTIGAFVTTSQEVADKEFFVGVLSSVRDRPKEDVGFFSYGEAEAKLKNYRIKKEGKTEYLILDFVWRNVGSTASMFAVNVGVTVYQDGIELHEGYLLGERTETATSIMPGKELAVKAIFELRSSSGSLDIIVDKFLDVTHKAVDRIYSFPLK